MHTITEPVMAYDNDSALVSSDPVSRPRRARGSLNGDDILDAAARIVEHEGLDALSMPHLARAMGCGVTSLYWYFRSKDDLVEALMDRVGRDALTRLPPVGDGPWDDELVRTSSRSVR